MPKFRPTIAGRAAEPLNVRQSPLAIQAHQIDAARNPTDPISAITCKTKAKRRLESVNDARWLDTAV